MHIAFFMFIARWGVYCSFQRTYTAQFYLYFVYKYLKGVFALFFNCILITVSLYRCMLVVNKSTTRFTHNFRHILLGLFVFCALFYTPALFTREVVASTVNNSTKVYATVLTSLGKTFGSAKQIIRGLSYTYLRKKERVN